MNHLVRITGVAALGLTMLTAVPAVAHTQDHQGSQARAVRVAQQNFSKAQLQKFVQANSEIASIRQSATQKIQQVDGKQARERIAKQARQNMLQAIKDSGLTLKQYNQIARAARSNPQLAKRIKQLQ